MTDRSKPRRMKRYGAAFADTLREIAETLQATGQPHSVEGEFSVAVDSDEDTDGDLAVCTAASATPGALKGLADAGASVEWSRRREVDQDGTVWMSFRARVGRETRAG